MYILQDELCSPEVNRRVLQVAAASSELIVHQYEGARSGEIGDVDSAGLAGTLRQQQSVARVLSDFGFQCSATVESFRQVIHRDMQIANLDESQVADLLVSFVPHSQQDATKKQSEAGSLALSLLQDSRCTDETGQLRWWNLDVVATVLKEDCKSLNWSSVVRGIDRASFLFVPSEAEFVLFTKLFTKISGRPLPAVGLMSVWDNRQVQLAFIAFASSAQKQLVDFSELLSGVHLDGVDVPCPPNNSWLCVPLYSTLLAIAARGSSADVVKILTDAASLYPEYVLLGLAQVSDQLSGVRTEILRRILRYFTGLSGSRPSSNAIMMKLFEINQDLLVLLCRIGLKNAQTVQEIIQIDTRLKSFGSFAMKVQEACNIDEILGYWCVLADRGQISSLEERLRAILEENPILGRNMYLFAKAHVENLRPRSVPDGGVLSYENFSSILKCVQNHPNVVSIQDLRTLATMASQHQQQMQSGIRTGDRPPPQGGGEPPQPHQSQYGVEGRAASSAESEEIEEVANSYFQKIYTSDMSIDEVIQLLKRFKVSADPREQEIFRCMIHNLFDEYRFFHKYPEKELQVTGRLFGTLIQNQLVTSITLGIALRYVLEALRKDPEQGGSNEKMFRFGKISLEQFRSRLNEWPQYCSHLVQIPHLANHCAELFVEAQRAVNNPAPQQQQDASAPPQKAEEATRGQNAFGPASTYEQVSLPQLSAQHAQAMASEVCHDSLKSEAPTANGPEEVICEHRRKNIEKMCAINMEAQDVQVPSEAARDQILFIVNNIAKSNVEAKTNELRSAMEASHYNWFANYLIVKRVSTQPNLHQTYLAVIDIMDSPSLLKAVLVSGYHNITKLLQSSKITTSSSERSLLRNLGMWLGQLTLARNKPILQRRCDLKELLLWGYESGRLIAVCSFVAKTVEGCKESKVFRPPNPWLMAVLGVMRELFEVEDLKMNIKFEVQVLCKNIGVRLEDIPKSNLVAQCTPPIKEKNPDFNVKSSNQTISPSLVSQSSPPPPSPHQIQASPLPQPPPRQDIIIPEDREGGQPVEHTVIPNLASHIMINPSFSHPALRRIVPLAVDRAIREIIQPVVERSVTIACVTTQQMILKDFALEPNETLLRKAAHLMVSNLAGSLALVTCKEPLRVSIGNHLRSLLTQSGGVDQNLMEQIVQVCSNENLELGCMLIEKAATEKAIRDIDEALAPAIQLRRRHNESGTQFADANTLKNSRFPRDLPDSMKPSLGGLSAAQSLVYDGFQRQRSTGNPGVPPAHQPQVVSAASPQMSGMQAKPSPQSPSLPPANAPVATLSMAQALESYQHVLSRVDAALKSVLVQAQGREVSLAMLGGDHEILARLRDIIHITQCTVPGMRMESALTFAESVFKRLVETVSVNDSLRLEVMVGILEALRDAFGASRKFAPDMISWLSQYATLNVAEEGARKLHRDILTLLMRAKLLRAPEVDTYFANNLDVGRNMVWVELALGFIRHSLAENLAATYEFAKVFDIVSKMRPSNTVVRKQLQKWLTDIRVLAAAREDQKGSAASSAPGSSTPSRDSVREHVMLLLDRWLRVWTSSNDQVFGQYLQLLHQYGVLKTEEAADRFFRIACEICVEACIKSSQSSGDGTTLVYTVIDALSKLFLLLVRLADKEASDVAVRINLLNRILHAVARTLVDDHESKKLSSSLSFDQRPYCRLFSNLMQDLGIVDSKQESTPTTLPLLATYSQIYLALQPSTVPGFCFGWLQLISHKCFMPHLLHGAGQKGWPYMHRLLISLLQFLQPFLRSAQLVEPIRRLYKGTLRVLLVLLHDFPEFLCDYHLSFCEVMPHPCVQMRNLVLSAFPRSMRLPDPFTPNLKVDLLPEITQSPRILTDIVSILGERGLKSRLDTFLASQQPQEFLEQLVSSLSSAGGSQVFLTTSVVMYVASYAVGQQQQQKTQVPLSVAMDIYKHLVTNLDAEARYSFFNIMANQLRYPNNLTHFFSCVILSLFAEAENEFIQEQITRVLLERLIVHRPHPVRFYS